uniref:Uncharacterized protein n=1 Tax=uncultured bacterium pAX1 TaxID=1781156 RepID=A0A1C9U4I2_9BACT|nr:hypothetical protein [uncultured bacterium pAX1]
MKVEALTCLCLTQGNILLSGISFCTFEYLHTSYSIIAHIHPE